MTPSLVQPIHFLSPVLQDPGLRHSEQSQLLSQQGGRSSRRDSLHLGDPWATPTPSFCSNPSFLPFAPNALGCWIQSEQQASLAPPEDTHSSSWHLGSSCRAIQLISLKKHSNSSCSCTDPPSVHGGIQNYSNNPCSE